MAFESRLGGFFFVIFDEHESAVIREAIGRDSGTGKRYTAEGFDRICVQLIKLDLPVSFMAQMMSLSSRTCVICMVKESRLVDGGSGRGSRQSTAGGAKPAAPSKIDLTLTSIVDFDGLIYTSDYNSCVTASSHMH